MSFVQEKTFSEAKALVLARLRQDKSELPRSEWDKKRYILDAWRTLSINELIDEVEGETPLGEKYVRDVADQLNIVIR